MCLAIEKLQESVTPKAVICCTLSNPGTAGGGISVWRFDLDRMNTISVETAGHIIIMLSLPDSPAPIILQCVSKTTRF